MKNITDKVVNFTWYFEELPDPQVIISLVLRISQSLEPMPSSLTFLDNAFKEKKGPLSEKKLEKLFVEGCYDETLGLHIFSKNKNEDNRFPQSQITLSRISVGDPVIHCLSVSMPYNGQAKSELIVQDLVGLVNDAFSPNYGFGTVRARFNLDFDYGDRHLMHSENPSNDYNKAAENIQYYRKNLSRFLQVSRGKMMLSVFRFNLISGSLYQSVVEAIDGSSITIPGEIVSVGGNSVLWSIEEAEARKLVFETTTPYRLIFDPNWFDLDGYSPDRSTFGLP